MNKASIAEAKEPFICEFCQFNFKHWRSWVENMTRVHVQNIDNLEKKGFKCNFCEYTSEKQYWLKLHKSKFHNCQSTNGIKSAASKSGALSIDDTEIQIDQGNFNKPTLEETCSSLLDLLDNDKKGTEDKAISELMELNPYNIKQVRCTRN